MASSPAEPEAVLITGAYGTGKTTLAIEIAGFRSESGAGAGLEDLAVVNAGPPAEVAADIAWLDWHQDPPHA